MKAKQLLANPQQLIVVLVLLVKSESQSGMYLTIKFIGRTPRRRIPARSKTKFYVKQQT